MKRALILASACLVLAACSSEKPSKDTSQTRVTSPSEETLAPAVPSSKDLSSSDVSDMLNSSDEFFCEGGDILIVSMKGGDSFYRNATDQSGRGLEEITLDYVSYARFTAPTPSDASPARKEIIEKYSGSWVTSGNPDTIALEELPASASKCLEFFGLDPISEVTARADGSLSFLSGALTGSVNKSGLTVLDENSNLVLFIGTGSIPASSIPEYAIDASGKKVLSPVATVSMEEFQLFVGGA